VRLGPGRHGSAAPRRNDRKRLPVAELRRLERRAEAERANRQNRSRGVVIKALVPRQASDTVA
jgi:hypothetical protein